MKAAQAEALPPSLPAATALLAEARAHEEALQPNLPAAVACYARGALGEDRAVAIECARRLALLHAGLGEGSHEAGADDALWAALEAGLCEGPWGVSSFSLPHTPYYTVLLGVLRAGDAEGAQAGLRSYALAVFHLAQRFHPEADGSAVDFDLCVQHFEDVTRMEAGKPLAAAALRGLVFACQRMGRAPPGKVQPPPTQCLHARECAYAARGAAACLALADARTPPCPRWRAWTGEFSLAQAYAQIFSRMSGKRELDWRGCMAPAVTVVHDCLGGGGREGSYSAMAALMARGAMLGAFPGIPLSAKAALAWTRTALPSCARTAAQFLSLPEWPPRCVTACQTLCAALQELHDKVREGLGGGAQQYSLFRLHAFLLLTLQRGCALLTAAMPRSKTLKEPRCFLLRVQWVCSTFLRWASGLAEGVSAAVREGRGAAQGAEPAAEGAEPAAEGAEATVAGAGSAAEGAGPESEAQVPETEVGLFMGRAQSEDIDACLAAAEPELTIKYQQEALVHTLTDLGELDGPHSGCAACTLALVYRDGDARGMGLQPDVELARKWAARAAQLQHGVPKPGMGGHDAIHQGPAHSVLLDPEYEVYGVLSSPGGGGGGGADLD